MSKRLLYTVQGPASKQPSCADTTGLTKLLGYRPVFCTSLNPDSLTDSWFRIWSSAPQNPETIYFFWAEEEDCIPVNVVDWTNRCLSKNTLCSNDVLESVLHNNIPNMTDYLVKEIPRDAFKIDTMTVYKNPAYLKELFLNAFSLAPNLALRMENSIINTQVVCQSLLKSQQVSFTVSESKVQPESIKSIYPVMTMTGLIPALFSIFIKKELPFWLIESNPCVFNPHFWLAAQDLLIRWDHCIQEGIEFTYEEYEELRSLFYKTLNEYSHIVLEDFAKEYNIGRNDKCFCGSGKKFKQCHGIATLDQVIKESSFYN